MRVLVAGGAGFIGSHVCRALLARGNAVVCLDNLSTGSRDNIRPLLADRSFTFVEDDVTRVGRVSVDRILHLASPASPIDYDRLPLETMAANSLGTWRLLELAADTGAGLTYASTSEVYGDPLVHPQPETYWGNVDPVGPRSCYDESKRFGEALLFAMRRTTRVRANVVRLFNTYGPRMRPDDGRAIPEMLTAALAARPIVVHGDGGQTRSFCYVADLVDGLLHVVSDPLLDGEILNLGNPAEITMRRLAEEVCRVTGSSSEITHVEARTGDPCRRKPDINKFQRRYGWRPKVSLEEGLRATAEWFSRERDVEALTA
jgi:dTDP-glucose 4,6-dehydratase